MDQESKAQIIPDKLSDDQHLNDGKNTNIEKEVENNFGWNRYSEITNGRFAMIGILAIIIIEFLNKEPFLNWAGILN